MSSNYSIYQDPNRTTIKQITSLSKTHFEMFKKIQNNACYYFFDLTTKCVAIKLVNPQTVLPEDVAEWQGLKIISLSASPNTLDEATSNDIDYNIFWLVC